MKAKGKQNGWWKKVKMDINTGCDSMTSYRNGDIYICIYSEMRVVEVCLPDCVTVLPGWGSRSREGISLYVLNSLSFDPRTQTLTPIIALAWVMHSSGFETCRKHQPS